MDKIERIKMVKAMEYVARQINDEEVLEDWFVNGVADGDIEYGDLGVSMDDLDDNYWNGIEYYTDDVHFADLMYTFLRVMSKARKSGGLYCDKIIDKAESNE